MEIRNNTFKIIFLIFATFCTPKEEVGKKDKNNNKIKTTEWIFGEWGIYSSFSSSTQIHCNVCPKIIFDKKQNAVLVYPSQIKEYYSWNIQRDTLILNFNHGVEGRKFFGKKERISNRISGGFN